MDIAEVLLDAFDRVRQSVHEAVESLRPEQLAFRPDADANSIAWLVWHLTRVQDDHVAQVSGFPQLWTSEGWADRFALPFAPSDIGYGHNSSDVAKVRVESSQLLTEYYEAVHRHTASYLADLRPDDLDRIVDRNWDPPVSLGVRLVSVINDDLQHAGQACYLRGIVLRR